MSRKYDVHLLYNNRDKAIIEQIDNGLRKRGINPWFHDRDVPPGEEWEREELASIKSTPASVVFLGPSGWGPTQRRLARVAHDSGRQIVPVVLPGWQVNEDDLSEIDGVFKRFFRIEFETESDADALNKLAKRIAQAAYGNGTRPRNEGMSDQHTGSAVLSAGRRMIVYVPARSQSVDTWDSLRRRLETEAELENGVWYPHRYTGSAWSREGIESYALDLEANIEAQVAQANREDPSRPINGITLMGHSFGGVIVRMAYLVAAGQYTEVRQHPSAWWKLVDRIVLFAAPNRGIEAKRYPLHERPALYWPIGRLGRLARDQLRGSEAITNLRIRWIRFFAQLEPGRQTVVVQLLGKGDRVVRRNDSLDIEQFPQAWQSDIPGATHTDIHVVPVDDIARYNLIRQGILDAPPAELGAQRREEKRNPVVIVVHGIRASNETWAEQICEAIRTQAPNSAAVAPTYRYFPMLDFAIPWLRAKKIRWVQDQYSNLLAQYPRARFCFVGHSNGTYMLGHSLERVPGMVFDRVTLVGSVLPREYDWNTRFRLGQVQEVTNHRATSDIPVTVFCNLLRAFRMTDVGTAGFDGFDDRREEIKEVYYYEGGHSRALQRTTFRTLWTMPFVEKSTSLSRGMIESQESWYRE